MSQREIGVSNGNQIGIVYIIRLSDSIGEAINERLGYG